MSTLAPERCSEAEVAALEAAFDALSCFAVLVNYRTPAQHERSDRVNCHLTVRSDGQRTLLYPVQLVLTVAPSTHALIVHEDELLMAFDVVLEHPGDSCEMSPIP